jgi:aldose 1-epimerase
VNQVVLTTDHAKAIILPERGALVSSLHLGGTGKNIIWMPDEFDATASSWPGGGIPFLFPFAGRVWHQGELYKYGLNERSYPMPLHGFSWAVKWSIVSQEQSQLRLSLVDTETSRSIFPFKFEIDMVIALENNQILIESTMKHIGPSASHTKMPVAVGWHPYFNLNSTPLTANIPAKMIHPVTNQGSAGKAQPVSAFNASSTWNIPNEHLKSLILSNLDHEEITAQQGNTNLYKLSFGPKGVFNHIVTWTNQPDRFICIEPWMSLPDAVATPTGCHWLKAGEKLTTWFKISI